MKTKFIVAIVWAAFAMAATPAIFWLGGYDFNERGSTAVFCAIMSLLMASGGALVACAYPDNQC